MPFVAETKEEYETLPDVTQSGAPIHNGDASTIADG
jgi:hypothetical protein